MSAPTRIELKKGDPKRKLLPKIAVIAGVHGDEATPMLALNILEDKDFSDVAAMVHAYNAVNIEAVRQCKRGAAPGDTSDLNRRFTDEYDPAAWLRATLNQYDVIIDLHSSPSCAACVLVNLNDEKAIRHAWWLDKVGAQVAVRYSSQPTIKKYFNDKGKDAFTVEMNKMGTADEQSARAAADMVMKMILGIDKINDTPHFRREQKKLKPMETVYSSCEGLITSIEKHPGEKTNVNFGSNMIRVKDLRTGDYNTIQYEGPEGTVITGPDRQYVTPGMPVMMVQPDVEWIYD